MSATPHNFHIPVMGTGHSVDTPIRVAHLGIDSVISIVDDLLLEKIRKHYSQLYDIPFTSISRSTHDGRAKRISAYLDTVNDIVQRKFDDLKSASFSENTEKNSYFRMLPETNPLRSLWEMMTALPDSDKRKEIEQKLTSALTPGSIDVNIMAKVDHLESDSENKPYSSEFSDACAALRGYAESAVQSAVVLSAGFNPRLYNYIAEFPQFYRDTTGHIKKKIILKVSDFRSALIQGKYLAKKGLEISEFRIESGLNCGGHAFYSDGRLLPVLLDEFREKKSILSKQFKPLVTSFYEKMGWEYPEPALEEEPEVTVQGGIGNHGENMRLMQDYEVDRTGWGSPFLVVPEATCVDDPTLQLLINAGKDDLYLSKVSPLGVPFNNIRNSGSEQWTKERIEKGKPGSGCPKGFLKSNTEFTESPICTASSQYQLLKLAQISESNESEDQKQQQRDEVLAKTCLCNHLGNGSLLKLNIIKEKHGPQAICPGPNIAWFNGPYTLSQMTDHIYGRGDSLVSDERPHMFAKELEMNVDYLEKVMDISDSEDPKTTKYLESILKNVEEGMKYCQDLAEKTPWPGENLTSLAETVNEQQKRLQLLWNRVAVAT